mgnify:CR=1 FL=1
MPVTDQINCKQLLTKPFPFFRGEWNKGQELIQGEDENDYASRALQTSLFLFLLSKETFASYIFLMNDLASVSLFPCSFTSKFGFTALFMWNETINYLEEKNEISIL